MRKLFAAVALLVAMSGAAAAEDQAGWSYAYTNGAATATMTDDHGRVEATLSCRPPSGDIVISDYTLDRAARRATSATLVVGALTLTVPMTLHREGRKRVVVISLPQRPPFLAALSDGAAMTVTVNGRSHGYREGAAKQMKDVAYACWGS